mgnify:CR=1 FL=1
MWVKKRLITYPAGHSIDYCMQVPGKGNRSGGGLLLPVLLSVHGCWKLEAVKDVAGDPPAFYVQVITGLTRPSRGAFLPLTAIDAFGEKGRTDPLFAELDKICKAHKGMWNAFLPRRSTY